MKDDPAVVADVAATIRADRRPVRPAAQVRHDVARSIRSNAGERAAGDLDHKQGAVRQRNWTLREFQA
jgi:hypothetical protein